LPGRVGGCRYCDRNVRREREGEPAITTGELFVVGLVMAVGLVGIVVPVLPGTLLIWAAGAWWAVADGGGAARWTVFALMGVLLAVGMAAKYVLPARASGKGGAPTSTLLVGAVCAIIGFFVIPVIGLLIGGAGGIYLAELVRLRDLRAAGRTTWAAIVAFGVGMLIELGAGVAMALVWLAGALTLSR
jgi:uncharacterized protein YqgC (DUF456 family)